MLRPARARACASVGPNLAAIDRSGPRIGACESPAADSFIEGLAMQTARFRRIRKAPFQLLGQALLPARIGFGMRNPGSEPECLGARFSALGKQLVVKVGAFQAMRVQVQASQVVFRDRT